MAQRGILVYALPCRSYFQSRNCLREVRASTDSNKPIVLVHEDDPMHGGATLEALKLECEDEKLRHSVFADRHEPIVWLRIADFQLVSLKLILEAVLLHSPAYKMQSELALYVPGELAQQTLRFVSPVVLYVSRSNPGAAELVAELCGQFNTTLLSYTEETPDKIAVQPRSAVAKKGKPAIMTHFLLYLCKATYEGEPGQQLAMELREALTNKVPIVMAHENDVKKGGCAFERCSILLPWAAYLLLLLPSCRACVLACSVQILVLISNTAVNTSPSPAYTLHRVLGLSTAHVPAVGSLTIQHPRI